MSILSQYVSEMFVNHLLCGSSFSAYPARLSVEAPFNYKDIIITWHVRISFVFCKDLSQVSVKVVALGSVLLVFVRHCPCVFAILHLKQQEILANFLFLQKDHY